MEFAVINILDSETINKFLFDSYLKEINNNYKLDILKNSEDKLSILKNEIYYYS